MDALFGGINNNIMASHEERIVDFRPDHIDKLHIDVSIHPEEIDSLYLGCRTLGQI